MSIETETYTENIPEYAVCYLEYGDQGDLCDEEVKAIDEWIKSWESRICISYEDDSSFSSNPAFGAPCTCVTGKVTLFL